MKKKRHKSHRASVERGRMSSRDSVAGGQRKKPTPGTRAESARLRAVGAALRRIDFSKGDGLVPVVVQDAKTKKVLMLAYANAEALKKTLETGKAWFWSRHRNKLWMKGEESGNFQVVKRILADCDADALLYLVEAAGPACHTGRRSCFHVDLGMVHKPNRAASVSERYSRCAVR